MAKFIEEVKENIKTEVIRKRSKLEVKKSLAVVNLIEGEKELQRLNLEYFKLYNILSALEEENIDLKKKIQIEKSNTFINEKPNLSIY